MTWLDIEQPRLNGCRTHEQGNIFQAYLRGHPIGRADKRIPSSNCPVKLGAHAEVDQFDLGVVCEEDVLALDVSVDHFAVVQMRQPTKNLPIGRRSFLRYVVMVVQC